MSVWEDAIADCLVCVESGLVLTAAGRGSSEHRPGSDRRGSGADRRAPRMINLGNPVLAQGTPAAPTGVTVELARALAGRLSVPVELLCFDAARKSFEAMAEGRADICFLAIEPEREADGRVH